MATPTEGRADRLPVVSEAVTQNVLKEMEQFSRLAPTRSDRSIGADHGVATQP